MRERGGSRWGHAGREKDPFMKQYPELVDIIDRGFQGAGVLCNPQPCVCLEVHDGFWSFFFVILASLACFCVIFDVFPEHHAWREWLVYVV